MNHTHALYPFAEQLSNLLFKMVGPFFVADLSAIDVGVSLPVGVHGMEPIPLGAKTDPHTHSFNSFYTSEKLDVMDENGKRYVLPDTALTLVMPGIVHSWVPRDEQGYVGSIDHRHEEQNIISA